MYWMKIQSRQENTVYLALWGMLFAAPVLSLYVRSVSMPDFTFQWSDILMVWKLFVVYFLLFLVHNFVLAPMLIHRQKRVLYFSIVAVILSLFIIYQCSHRPQPLRHGPPPIEQIEKMEEFKRHRPPEFKKGQHVPPIFFGEHDVVAVVVLVLMFGMNLGVKGYFKGRSDQKKLAALQKENLAQQLEYLKYQINPHFFMNTLNNIHALVDIDPEKAKSTILELSKMMRFILYEGDKNGVPLTREFDFIRHYVTLMRLRYTDKVRIEIEIKASVSSSRLHFTCHNSKADTPNQEKGGVGLANVKQRLQLLYDNNFTLNIHETPETYTVELNIPLTPNTNDTLHGY